MTAAAAKDYLTKQPADPATGWLTSSRVRSAVDVIYADMTSVNQVVVGTASPGPGDGVDGDVFVDTANGVIYGPKAAGAWPAGVSLVGPTGATGATGATGETGATGATGPGLAAGGSTGQIVVKASGADYDTAWADRWIVPLSTKTTTYTATVSDQVLVCTGTFTVTLPAASTAGVLLQIKNKGTGVITVDGNGAETIDDQASITLAQYEGVTLVADGTEWWIL